MKTTKEKAPLMETKADQRRDINAKLAAAREEQEALQTKRLQKGIELEEFMDISNRLNILSTTIDLQKKKLANLDSGKAALGEPTPGLEVGTNSVGGGYKK
jgi:hypothetical protein